MKTEGFPNFRNKEELKTSIDQGWDVNKPSKNLSGLVPLTWASQFGLFDCVKILLESKADPNIIESEMSCLALHFACFAVIDNCSNAEECIKLLLKHTTNINTQTISGRTCIHILCYYQQTECAKLLIDARADLEIRNKAGKTALEVTIYKSDDTTKFLLNNGAKMPSKKHEVSEEVSETLRKLKCIKRVLITFFALSKKTGAIHKDLINPIAKMVWETREDDAWDQKKKSKKMNQEKGQFQIFLNKEELKTCIDRGFDVNASSKSLDNLTPLMWASSRGLVDCVKILLELKADPNSYDTRRSYFPLHASVRYKPNNIEIAKILINHGANINAQTILGTTALHVAVSWNDQDFVKYLINARADLQIRNVSKQTALDEAINYVFTNDRMITLLLNNGAKFLFRTREFSKEVSSTIRKLRCIKRVLITFFALSRKTGAIHKDLRNPIAKMVWETREDDVWDQKKLLEKRVN